MDAALTLVDGSADLDAAPVDAAFSDIDSPYTTYAAMRLATPLCRTCESLRCGDDAAACASDAPCVIAAQCLTTCSDASCSAACTDGDSTLGARASAYTYCAFETDCRVPCFGVPEPRSGCGMTGEICDPLVESIATCCDGAGTCPEYGGACCRASGEACDPTSAAGDAQCCGDLRCDADTSQCVATTCIAASGPCSAAGLPCCDTGLSCTTLDAIGPHCCGADGAVIADTLPCCSGSFSGAGPGLRRCEPSA